jgi:hypothetical protein
MIEAILNEREKTHGSFMEHARITQELKAIMFSGYKYPDLSPSQTEALDMIAHKIGRILAGNPNHKDHWVDIVGYAQLIVNQLPE